MSRRHLDFVSLEDRTTPATFTVTTTADNGIVGSPIAGSIREAIVNANATPGADTIVFNISGTGIQTINLQAGLNSITEAVTIDATTQPGFNGSPVIELNGAAIKTAVSGFNLVNHTGTTIRGFTLNGFHGAGIRIDGGGSHVIAGNWIGVNSAGTAASANAFGIFLNNVTTNNTIGGTDAASRNVISGNTNSGIHIESTSSQNTISGNFIGTSANGSVAVANGTNGVEIIGGSFSNTVGGTVAGSGNIIAGNTANGVYISDAFTKSNVIQGNRIGIGFNGLAVANGGDGIQVANGVGSNANPLFTLDKNVITKNTIASNTGNGIAVLDTSRFIQIETNSITNNGLLGIDIDPTANGSLPAPQITNVFTNSTGIQVVGTAVGPANTSLKIEIFGSSTADPSGFGEGTTSLGTVTVTTNASGVASFTLDIASASSPVISATAQNTTTFDTSSFSLAQLKSTSPPPPQYMNRFAVGTGAGVPGVVQVFDALGNQLYQITPFGASFTGGIRVAMADVNGDGALDLIAGTGPGIATQVNIYDGKTQQSLFTINPFEAAFTGGVYVSGGDIDGDGKAEFIITPDEGGGPRVRIFRGSDFTQISDFFGIADPNFRGGARSAIGDLNKDGKGDVIVAAGFGGGPRIAAFSGATLTGTGGQYLFGDFFAFESTLRNGAYVAVGDVNGDGYADLITGGGPGGGPRVLILSGLDLTQSNGKQTAIANYFAGSADSRGGVRIASRLITGDNLADVLTGDGDGMPGMVRLFAGNSLISSSLTPTVAITPFGAVAGGVFVG